MTAEPEGPGTDLIALDGELRKAEARSDEVFELYCRFRDAHPLESPTVLASRITGETGIPSPIIHRLMEAQQWESKYLEYKNLEASLALQSSAATAIIRHLRLAQKMQDRAEEALSTLSARTLEEARRLAQTGIDIERLTMGQATQRVSVDVHEIKERINWLAGVLNLRIEPMEGADDQERG